MKALICIGGNPMAAWPDQRKTQRAMEKLDLLLTFDVEMSSTARLSDYVIACKHSLETPGMSQSGEAIKFFGTGIGFPSAYAQYSPRITDPPPGSDVVEEWEFFYDMASHLDLELTYVAFFGTAKYVESPMAMMVLDKNKKPTTEEIYEIICSQSRIPLTKVKQYPHGHIFDGDVFVNPKDPDCEARLALANDFMMAQLTEVYYQNYQAQQDTPDYPFRYIPRRHNNFMNSAGRSIKKLTGDKPWNPLWMHPEDLNKLGISDGDSVNVATEHDSIPAIVEGDASLLPGVVAMAHAFGGLVGEDHLYHELGSNTGRLIRTEVDYDPITGMPRMGNIPVAITPVNTY